MYGIPYISHSINVCNIHFFSMQLYGIQVLGFAWRDLIPLHSVGSGPAGLFQSYTVHAYGVLPSEPVPR